MTRTLHLAAALSLCACLSACGSPKSKPDFDVAVTLTPAAVARLKAANETAVLDAYYFGAPTEATRDKVNDDGQIELGQDLVSFPASSQTVHVSGNGMDSAMLDKVADGKVSVTLRVYSNTDQPDMLKCTPVTVALTDAQAKTPAISCDAG